MLAVETVGEAFFVPVAVKDLGVVRVFVHFV